jgi:hypothetical protein
MRYLLAAVLCFLALSFFSPIRSSFIAWGLDGSWVAALTMAREQNLHFGSQIIFTSGPLSHLYGHTFHASLLTEKFLSVAIFVAFFAAFFNRVLSSRGSLILALIIGAQFLLSIWPDPIFLGIPLCASLALIDSNSSHRGYALVLLGAAACATATLTKFSVFPMAVLGFALCDLVAIFDKKRWPLALMTYVLCLAIGFEATSPGASFLESIQTSLDVATGYKEAMSQPGPWPALAGFVAVGIGVVALFVVIEARWVRAGRSSVIVSSCRVACMAAYIYLCAQAGLVRYDIFHNIIFVYGLVFAVAIYCAVTWASLSWRMASVLILLIGAGLVSGQLLLERAINISREELLLAQVTQPYDEIFRWADFLTEPDTWWATQQQHQAEAIAYVQSKQPLPALVGTVDSIPSIQSSLIAKGLRYRPRPSFQEYVTFTHDLIERNRAFFQSSSAPDYLFMAPGSIDGRHPALTEGPLWPLFLSRYAPQNIFGDLLLLQRRRQALDVPLRPISTPTASWNTPIVLEPTHGVIFATIDIRRRFRGRVADLFLKSTPVYLRAHYTDGSEGRYRLIPAIAREGFVISPLIESTVDYLRLALGRADLVPRRVQWFSVEVDDLEGWRFQELFAVTLASLDDSHLRDVENWKNFASELTRSIELQAILQANPAKLATAMVDDKLGAHPPSRLTLDASGRTKLEVSFGLFDGAWQGEGHTDGVCFRVLVAGTEQVLWERCLDPKVEADDRGSQIATIALPDGVGDLVAETTCRFSCEWDWAYWKTISLR